jgi:hypothetical protein
MARIPFSPDELRPSGKFYPSALLPSFGGIDLNLPPEPTLNRPIAAKENFRLLFSGKKPWWIPAAGFMNSDVQQFRPRLNPDNVANHQVIDGGPQYDFSKQGEVARSSWFDLDWVWVEAISGATVRPGNDKIPDIMRWEKYVSMPNLDDLDWENCAKQNVEYLGSDKLNELGIQCGFWERLMACMDVVEASIAYVDEETKPAVRRFNDAYADLLCDYISRIKKICNIDAVVVHTDWAHARAPFFSVDTLREIDLPYVKRVVDHCHSLGLFYEIHCCGACELLIPFFIETGADMWCGQSDLNDLGGYAKKYRDSKFVFGIPAPDVPPDAPLDEARRAAKAWVDEYRDCHVAFCMPFGPAHPELPKLIYEYSRIAYRNEA